uniref:Apolipoprotein M n=1 Tax=Fundulus heteroclitus TaxID=8078 RepID=A0A3Q2PAR7_FUNHE
MFALCVVGLFCWASVSQSAPTPCENLLRPVENLGFRDVRDSWALVAVSAVNPEYLGKLKLADSGRAVFANHTDSTEISFTRILNMGESCQYMQTNVTLDGSTFSDPQLNMTMTLLQRSCTDCMVVRLDKKPGQPLRLYLFSRRREVEATEMEEFKAQATCLNMSEHHVMDPTKELCPEQISRNTATTDSKKQV